MPEIRRRQSGGADRGLFSAQDAAVLLQLPLLAAIAVLVPERHWERACLRLERLKAAFGISRTEATLAGMRLLRAATPEDALRAKAAQTEHYVQVLRERLAGWSPHLRVEGLEHVEAARALGRGAVLWVGHFAFNALAAKIAFHRAGIDVVHLSRPEHGFTKTRFGIRFLNPIRTGAELAHLRGRIVFDRTRPAASMYEARRALLANRCVSITAGSWEGQLLTRIGVDGAALDLSTGAPRLASLAGAPVLPVFVVRDDADRSIRVTIGPPIPLQRGAGRDDMVMRAAQEFGDRMAPVVEACPHQWREWEKLEPASTGRTAG